MKAVILAGGQGTRLRRIASGLPKSLVTVCGVPVLERQIVTLTRQGISDITVLAGYKGEMIRDFCGNGTRWAARIDVVQEREPLGTAGALRQIRAALQDDFAVIYGDLMFDVDVQRIRAAHQEHDPLGTLMVHPNEHPYDSDLLEVDEHDRVTRWLPKKHRPPGDYANMVNAAIYVLSPRIFDYIGNGASDFGADVFPRVLAAGEALMAYRTSEYLKDMGTEDRLERVTADLTSGRVAQRNLSRPQAAILLDRDGTLNAYRDFVCRPEQLELLPGVAQAIQRINRSRFLAICVTNQPVIARNLCTVGTLQAIHNRLETLLCQQGAYLDRIYYCPHHPDAGYPEERREFKIRCSCRKPETGMLLSAKAHYNIDFGQSFLIGDSTCDAQTAHAAGVRSVLVRTGEGGRDGKYAIPPDLTFDTLREAVDFIVTQDGRT